MGFDAGITKAMEDQRQWDVCLEQLDPRKIPVGQVWTYSVGDTRHDVCRHDAALFICCGGYFDAPNIWTHMVQNGPIHNGSRHSVSGLTEAAEMARLTSAVIASFGIPPADVGEADYDGWCLVCNAKHPVPQAHQIPPAVPVDPAICPECKAAKLPEHELCFYCEQLALIKPRTDRDIECYDMAVRAAAEMQRQQRFVRHRKWRTAAGTVMLVAGMLAGWWWMWVLGILLCGGPPWYRPRPVR